MTSQEDKEVININNCITGKTESLSVKKAFGQLKEDTELNKKIQLYSGPGLIDIQVNGINGIDFNTPLLSKQDLINANQYLLSTGVTTFFPTVVTNSDENIVKILSAIHKACEEDSLLNSCIAGIHLEGPFISPSDGARGAHNESYVKAPDWKLFEVFQKAAGGKIKIVTLAPEWDGAFEFIERCTKQGILVSIGHSLANPDQIRNAVKAGARLSTHLGNGVPLMLQRHPNIIWEQLAQEKLFTCLIADGIHVPDSFLKVVMKTKGNQVILVSDATLFVGMPPGEYRNNIGGNVIVDVMKRVSMKNSPGLLAGAGKTLLECIEYLLQSNVLTLSEAWQMASLDIINMVKETGLNLTGNINQDKILFDLNNGNIEIIKTLKNGKIVFEQ